MPMFIPCQRHPVLCFQTPTLTLSHARAAALLRYEPLTVHRLDIETSGVNLFAKTKAVVNHLQEQFR